MRTLHLPLHATHTERALSGYCTVRIIRHYIPVACCRRVQQSWAAVLTGLVAGQYCGGKPRASAVLPIYAKLAGQGGGCSLIANTQQPDREFKMSDRGYAAV